MDCLTAQALVSEAMDHQPVDAAVLAQAKEHCRACPECALFVRAQLIAKQTPLPTAPDDLADRVMQAVRAEAQAAGSASESKAGAKAAATHDAEPASSGPDIPIASLAPPKPRKRRRLPRPLAVGLAAAAMLVALLGAGALLVFGTKQMSTSPTTAGVGGVPSTTANSQAEAPSYMYRPDTTNGSVPRFGAAPGSQGTAGGAAKTQSAVSSAPQAITVGGVVYTQSGAATVDTSTMTAIGNTTSALGGGKQAIQRSVYQGLSADTVYVANDSGQVLAFTRATRSYLGLTYVLTAADLTDFGQWPNLPSQYAAPTSADGAPTFAYDGTDSNGVKVYRLAAGRATDGIAVAPNTDTSGPGAGDPNWTWWAVIH